MPFSHSHIEIDTRRRSILEVIQDLIARPPTNSVNPDQQPIIDLVICSGRTDFLEQLTQGIQSWRPPRDEIPASQEDDDDDDNDDHDHAIYDRNVNDDTLKNEPSLITPMLQDDSRNSNTTETRAEQQQQQHPLLRTPPTLHLLRQSQNIRVTFCHNISAFRAFIAAYRPRRLHCSTSSSSSSSKMMVTTTMIIVNLLLLHHSTSEFSVQGLGRTFAALASTAHRTGLQVKLVETETGTASSTATTYNRIAHNDDENDDDDDDDNDNNDDLRIGGVALWDAEVPLLSGSVSLKLGGGGSNRSGGDGGVGGWARGRKVSVRNVVERWCRFDDDHEDCDSDNDDVDDDDDEQ